MNIPYGPKIKFYLKEVNLLLRPIATCSEYLNMDLMRVVFENTFRRLIESIKNLQGDDFKDKVKPIKSSCIF